MAGFDPNQPRDKEGEWIKASSAARKAAGLPDEPFVLKPYVFEDFNQQGGESYIKTYIENMSDEFELEIAPQIMDDKEFYALIGDKARKMGISPSEVRMFYDREKKTVGIKNSTVSSIKSQNDLRLFMQTLDHELSHAVWFQTLKRLPERLTATYDYNASISEEFAEVFSSRIGVLRMKSRKGQDLPKDLKSYLFEGTLLQLTGGR